LSPFRPQWHHVFPKKYLEGKVDDALVNALANIAVIGADINLRISAKDPLSYIDKYDISLAKLSQQFIDTDIRTVLHAGYAAWLSARARRLADEGNRFLNELRDGLLPRDSKPPSVSPTGEA
jgi:hypothetical protein